MYGHLAQVPGGQGPSQQSEHVHADNVAVDSSANSLITVHTDKAVAFVNPMTHVEAYRPEKGFSDAVKGFVLYQAKIVRPKELVVLNCKAGA